MFLLPALAACGQKPVATPTLAPAVPYQTVAPTLTPSLPPVLREIIQPTPTVFTYTVVQGDTLGSIAQRHGISLESLLAANPGISATALSIGTKLVIPASNQITVEPTVTPAPLPVQQAHCWPESAGGLWCFALLKNDLAETLENISAHFVLSDANGQELANQVAYGLLDILPPGTAMPLAAHFAGPVQADVSLHVQVLTAIRLLPGDRRYLPVRLENTLVSLDASGRTSQVSGQVLSAGTDTANTLWVLASAYDGTGNVVGMRRWESTAALKPDAPISFDFSVSSVGPAITRVEFIAEARP